MSNVHRLRLSDRIIFVCVTLRPKITRFHESECELLIEAGWRRLLPFGVCGSGRDSGKLTGQFRVCIQEIADIQRRCLRQPADRIFFATVNLRPKIRRFWEGDYPVILKVMEASRRRLGFLRCGYVLLPDHGHALIWTGYPLLIWQEKLARKAHRQSLTVATIALANPRRARGEKHERRGRMDQRAVS